MSITYMTKVFESNLPATERFILLAYADHSDNQGGNIYPAVSTIAKKTGYSERTVQRTTQELCKSGILVPDGKGKKGTNKWRIDSERLGGDTVSGVTDTEDGGDNDGTKGVTLTTEGVTTTTKRGDTLSPESSLTVIESSIKSSMNQDAKSKICALWNMPNGDGFETLLTTQQHIKMIGLLDRDAEKCFTIAQYYANEGLYFQKAIGKIINNFDTWKTQTKNQSSSSGLTFNN